MEEVSAPMTGPNKAVLFASVGIAVGLFLLTVEADSQNQFPAVIWAYTAWKTYKQDFPTLVFAQKVLAGIAALAVIWGAVTVGDAKSELILGLSPSDMILGGLISFIAHFWLLNFFKGELPDVSRSAVANQELLEKEDSAARITQTAQQETQVDSDPQIKQSDSTSGATASTEQAQPAGNKGVWITTIAVVMFLGLLGLGYEDLQEQGSADSSTVSKREIAKEPVVPEKTVNKKDKVYGKRQYDDDVYEGDFVEGIRWGKGKYTWGSGNVYVGDFVKGERTGKGKLTWPSGDVYEGDFVKDERTGKGKFTWPSGDIYEGDFVKGERTGKGKYTWPSGDVHIGEWKDGNITGRGISINGKTVTRGVWLDGTFLYDANVRLEEFP
jgi:hypothetical protein